METYGTFIIKIIIMVNGFDRETILLKKKGISQTDAEILLQEFRIENKWLESKIYGYFQPEGYVVFPQK